PVPINSGFHPPGPNGLPPDVVQRVVRARYPAFQRCYEDGLRRVPTLRGRVVVYFFVERTGALREVRDHGSELPDAEVVKCVVHEFEGLSFPPSESGVTTVVYPISFAPDD
ncbi:MAG: AgmX/PglI C-terminal domain-containing protein, partial [Myxococcales bacterium]